MTKKKGLPVKKYEAATFEVQETLLKTQASCMPTNLAEEKEKFLKNGKTPKFHIKDRTKVEQLALKTKNNIRFELFGEAQYILEKVRDTYGNGEYYLEHAFGPRITKEEATPVLLKYIAENNVPESLKINWCGNLTCSAKMVWNGPNVNSNRPELRKYSLWLNGSDENPYMRESGIRCLMDHEIGTHFYRSFNDGLQPWYADRERFGLRKLGTFEGQCTEEGLAAIHTVLRGRIQYLWGAAMGYYIACKSAEMTFKELFDHLGRFTTNPDYRWKQAMRVKRGLPNPNDLGGFGNDQCYFEGAVNILRRMEFIDFQLMMMGKVCFDELDRIKRVARKDVVQYPNFMKNINAYRRSLRKMLTLNGLDGVAHPQSGPPDVYVKHLEEKKRGKTNHKGKKVRSKGSSGIKSPDNNGNNAFWPNKMKYKDDDDNEGEGVKSFSCSHPFVNLHLQDRPMAEIEKILRVEPDSLRDVKELTGSISVKDDLLDKQLQRLQDILKNHQWTKADDCSLEDPVMSLKKDRFLPQIQRDIEPLSIGSRCYNVNELVVDGSSCINIDNLEDCKPETYSETITCTLCPNEDDLTESALTGEFDCDNGQSLCFQTNYTDDSAVEIKKKKHKVKMRSSSRPSSHQLLQQRSSKKTNRITPQSRRILYTPVASLAGYESDKVVPRKNSKSNDNNNGNGSSLKKRISLKSSKVPETETANTNTDGNISPPPSPSPPPPVNSCENLHRGVRSVLKTNTFDQNVDFFSQSNPDFKMIDVNGNGQFGIYPPVLVKQHNRSYKSKRTVCKSRPISTGSERSLEFQWMSFPTPIQISQQQRLLEPSVSSLLKY